jgi:glutathione synthase|tara:strand:+ start:3226 stop:4158 length:933 start_codon:yes stop_codon:yes gene_type:complete
MKNSTSLFITDPLSALNAKKDTTILWMQEIAVQEGQIFQCEMSDLVYSDGITQAKVSEILDALLAPQVAQSLDGLRPLNEFNFIYMRKDPPVDENYMNALHLLSQAKQEGAKVMNDPDALKKFNEKIFALQFSKWMPDTRVICKKEDLLNFKDKHQIIILKPLDGMGGESIYKFENLSSEDLDIFQALTNNFQTMVMVQNFLPEIYEGDYRILIIHGKPFPVALARIPQGDSFKGNLAAGGKGEARALSAIQQEVGEEIGALLVAEGITFAGIDMIGSYLTEINITSPTGAREILNQTQQNPIQTFLESL